jgi:hypothetical protein
MVWNGQSEAVSVAFGAGESSDEREGRSALQLVEAGADDVSEQAQRSVVCELAAEALRNGWASEQEVVRLLARLWNLPFADDDAVAFDATAGPFLQARARKLGACIAIVDGASTVVVAEPSEQRLAELASLPDDRSIAVVSRSALERLADEAKSNPDVQRGTLELEVKPADVSEIDVPADPSKALADPVLADLDKVTVVLPHLRAQVEALAHDYDALEDELARSREELARLHAEHQVDAAKQRELEHALAEERSRLTTARTRFERVLEAMDV